MSNQTRIMAAFLLSPLATPLVFMLAATMRGTFSFEDVPLYLAFQGFFAYLAVLLFGFPAYLFFRTRRWSSPLLFMLCGGLIGFLVSILLIPTFDRAAYFLYTLDYRMWFVLAGSSSALLFRLLLPDDLVSSSAANRFP
jgi:hypothetical protein